MEEGAQSLDEKLEQQVGEGGQPVELGVDVEQPVQNVSNTPTQQQQQRYAPPPLSQPSSTTDKCKSCCVSLYTLLLLYSKLNTCPPCSHRRRGSI